MDIANVRDFGAVGDGITDDTAAFFAAHKAAAESVMVPPGRYNVDKSFYDMLGGPYFVGEDPTNTVVAIAGKTRPSMKDPKPKRRNIMTNESYNDTTPEYFTFAVRINKKKLAIASTAVAVVAAGAAAFVFSRKNPELLADLVPVEESDQS